MKEKVQKKITSLSYRELCDIPVHQLPLHIVTRIVSMLLYEAKPIES